MNAKLNTHLHMLKHNLLFVIRNKKKIVRQNKEA
jgi:hypothetical protein